MRSLWALALFVVMPAAQAASMDGDFLAAREAFRTGNAARLDAHAARLQGHVLEPYLRYWRLRMRLEHAPPEEIRAFIAAHRDSPLSEQLRADWLRHLGRAQRWELFDAELPALAREDLELTCYALQSRMRLYPSEALREARPLWFITRELPESCTPLLEALRAAQLLSVEDVWMRVRLALEAGGVSQARRFAVWLPRGEAPDPNALAEAASNPAAYLERRQLDLRTRPARETAMFAAHRLARSSPQQAARRWEKLEERFSEEERAYVWGLVAYFGAMRHDPEALAWFARAGDLSDLQLAWKARAALRARDWPVVLAAIEAMTGAESQAPAWRYWKARALRELGRPEEAQALLKPLAAEFNFYGQLAVEDLGGLIDTPPAAYRPGAEEVLAMGRMPGIRRALELYRLNLRIEGNREWLWTIRDFDDRQLLAAAELARRHGIYDRAIATADRTALLHDFGLRYLAPYREVLQPHAAQLDLDEAWVFGFIRQESRFIVDARSRAGASGLMQLMPATARWVAKKLGLKNWRWSQVTEVNTNISLGTYYLRHVLDVLDGQPVLASAAYNAGPGRARAWRPEGAMEGAVYAETIPFNETRDYVKKVMANATYYAHAFSQELQSLRQRLGIIGPRFREREAPLGDTP